MNSKPSRDERWEARKRAKFSNENSFEQPVEVAQNLFSKKETTENQGVIFKPNEPAQNHNFAPAQVFNPPNVNQSPYNSNPNLANNFSPMQSLENKRFIQQQENPRGRTPPSNSFYLNPVSEAELKRQKMLEEYKSYAQNDVGAKRREERDERDVGGRFRVGDQQNYEEEKRRIYNLELKRQIEERESSKRMQKAHEKVEEYFPFGKPGAGAPNRDQSGRIIAARPPRFNENDPNFNRVGRAAPVRGEFYQNPGGGYSGNLPPGPRDSYAGPPPGNHYQQMPGNNYPREPADPYRNGPGNGYQANPYQGPPGNQYQPPPGNQYQPPPGNQYQPPPNHYSQGYSNPPPPTKGYRQEPEPFNYNPNISPPPSLLPQHLDDRITDRITDPRSEMDKLGEANKKSELQRALQEQIEEKKRQKDEEKRRKLLEERYEEDRLARERQQMEEEFKREADKKKKQINDLQSFNNNSNNPNIVLEPKKGRRPRTPIDLPPPEPPRPQIEEKRRGQSAINRSPQPINPNEIPQEYINFLNSALDRKLNEFKTEHKVSELKQQEEILRLRQRDQMHSEHSTEAQREIERLKDELRRKQVEDEIRHRELALALQSRPNVIPSTKLPPYEPRPLNLPKTIEDASLSFDFAQKSLISESKFIPLPNPTEIFPTKPLSPKEKKALHLDSIFPSLPDNASNYDTFRSASSSIGVDNLLKKNEERLKMLEKIDSGAQDELNKLDQILFKFAENDKKEEALERKRNVEGVNKRRVEGNEFEVGEGRKLDSESGFYEYGRKIDSPMLYSKGEFLPSIKELDGEATYSLPDSNKGLYGVY